MNVGYAVLYVDGTLVISKYHTILQKKIIKNYGEFVDTSVPWKNESSQMKTVQILNQVKSTYMKKWFTKCNHLTTLIDFKNLDVSGCTNFSHMFSYCESLQNINELQWLNVSNGVNFSDMFYHCKTLKDIDSLKTWNVSNGINFVRMFECTNIQNVLALENWNVLNGKKFSSIFKDCIFLQTISMPHSINYLTYTMFFNCTENLKIHWKNHIYTYEDLLEYQTIS